MSQETQTVKKNPKKLQVKDELPTSNELATDTPSDDTQIKSPTENKTKSSTLRYIILIGGGVISMSYFIYQLNKNPTNSNPESSELIQNEAQPEIPDVTHAKEKKRKF